MMTSHEITRRLELLFPSALAVEGDATGLQIHCESPAVERIGLVYELTDRNVAQMLADGVRYVIAFHPLIYRPLDRISPDDRVGRAVIELIRSETSLFITHTRLDAHPAGTNGRLAKALGADSTSPMVAASPEDAVPQGSGMGVLAHFHGGIRWRELIERVARVTGAGGLRSTVQAEERTVETVAIVAGSGMSYYGAACRGGADAVITGDVRYHDFHASHDRIPIIDPGHAESEVLVIDSTMEIIRNGADPDLARMIVPYAESTLPMEYLRPDGRD